MIPFYKILSLLVRSFSKPIITYAKKIPNSTDRKGATIIRSFFVKVGNTYHNFDVIVSRKFMKLNNHHKKPFIKPLSDDAAL